MHNHLFALAVCVIEICSTSSISWNFNYKCNRFGFDSERADAARVANTKMLANVYTIKMNGCKNKSFFFLPASIIHLMKHGNKEARSHTQLQEKESEKQSQVGWRVILYTMLPSLSFHLFCTSRLVPCYSCEILCPIVSIALHLYPNQDVFLCALAIFLLAIVLFIFRNNFLISVIWFRFTVVFGSIWFDSLFVYSLWE